ncbi:MAG: hypothetical protein H7267_02615 [Sandarakinorhabdus sp.]|nr:hypothetical protein [Sandarakinorhabdus sp.]
MGGGPGSGQAMKLGFDAEDYFANLETIRRFATFGPKSLLIADAIAEVNWN